jgi:Na+-translocating ferredoxin:NAD+ oxidoreductase RnfG subunit
VKKLLKQILPIAALILVGLTGPVRGQDDLTESPDGPEAVKVYFTPEEALAKVFPKADTLWTEEWSPTPQERTKLESRLAWRIDEETFVIHRAGQDGQDLGYAMITQEQGRFKPITFIVKLSVTMRVDMVLVMVYRESRGDGVKRQRFLKQFRGKDSSDHLRLNRDIVGVSGATMSSRALTTGVKKVLGIVEMKYPPTEAGK